MEKIGIRELKENMSRYMRKVKIGEKIVITDRKKEIAVIIPLGKETHTDKIYELIQQGDASWSGNTPTGMRKRIISKKRSVSSAVIEDRR